MTTPKQRAVAWQRIESLVEPLFSAAATKANASPAIDTLYVSRPDQLGIISPLEAIILHYGNHPARGAQGRAGGGLVVEGGCALYVGQDVAGTVFAYMTPFRTGLQPPPEPVILLNAFPILSLLRATYVNHWVQTLFAYARITQYGGSPQRGDSLRIRYAREHAEALGDPGKAVIKLIRLFLKVKSTSAGAGGFLGCHGLP